MASQSAAVDPQQKDQADKLETVAPIVRPDGQTQRYDRQLRLWASSGQASLESANVLLVGASHLGSQALKNLILPGIGSFTVLDGQRVSSLDIGNNFFLEPESQDHWRADEVTRLLAELNPTVNSSSKVADPAAVLLADPGFFSSFSLIIVANQPPAFVRAIGQLAWDARGGLSIPLLIIRGAGMVGEVRAQVRELGIIETHPASTNDLRLLSPWDELSDFAQSYDMEDKDAMAHSHIPFIIILLCRLRDWKQAHRGALPVPSKDRKAFADSINALRDPANVDTENFDEAITALGQNVWRPISSQRKIPADVEALFNDSSCQNISPQSSNFWLLVRALREFVAAPLTASPTGGGGFLPLPGSLPDFKATSSTYVAVQRIYKNKAHQDLLGFKGHLAAVLSTVGLPTGAISEGEIESFTKHAGYLKLVRGKSLRDSDAEPAKDVAALAFMDPVNPPTFQNHLAFRAVDQFYGRHGRFPGSSLNFSDSITGKKSGYDVGLASSIISSSSTTTRPDTPIREDSEPAAKRQKSESPYPSVPSRSNGRHSRPTSNAGTDAEGDGDAEMREASTASSDRGAIPSEASVDVENDTEECLEDLRGVLDAWGIEDPEQVTSVQDAVREMVRSGHGDIASTASLLGGVAAQEAIKFITRQYIPLEGTAIYDGIKQAIGTYRL